MTFHERNTTEFERLFESVRDRIAAFPGCRHVELLKDLQAGSECVYLTRSIWYSVSDLDAYRRSELFKQTWSATKDLFSAKAEAWSTTLIAEATTDGSN